MAQSILQTLDRTDILYDNTDIKVSKRHPYLIIFIGQDSGKRYQLNHGQTTVGRSPQADITLSDHRVSRIHCSIDWQPETITIHDEGSTNGTFVDSQKVEHAPILAGLLIQLGHTVMKIEYKDEAEIRVEENLLRQVSIDPLTGIFSKQHFMKLASMEMSYACRHQLTACAILMDLDNFTHVNDTYGYQTGDFILAQSVDIVNKRTRTEDLLARYSDEKFIIMPRGDIDRQKTFLQCERICKAIKHFNFRFGEGAVQITASLGFHLEKVTGSDFHAKLSDLISMAEQALYRAKEKGGDRSESL